MNSIIDIKGQYGITLHTREAAINLCKAITGLNISNVELDFRGVEFMSRSFADQFYKEREELRKNSISVFLINADEEIEKILEAVGRTQNKRERSYNEILVSRFSDMGDVSRLLHSF